MSLISQVERDRRRAVVHLGLLLIVAALAGAAVVWGFVRAADAERSRVEASAGQPQVEPTTGVLPDVSVESTGIWDLRPVEDGPLILPMPDTVVDGVPVGYPHTTEGAISAAVRYTQAAITLDVAQARRVGDLAAASSYLDAGAEFALAVESSREGLGLAPRGPTDGAYLTYQARAYLVRDATPPRVEVWVLGIVDGAGPVTSGLSRTGPAVAQHLMVWLDGDWRLTDTGDTPDVEAPAPGSAAAYAEGWRDLAIA